MRLGTLIAVLMVCGATGFAQEHIADTLRNGILEEDSKQNPRGAIQQYQVVMAQFEEARQTAATALFRMAECYRKQGNKPQAMAAYQRVLRDFADQGKLVAQSRAVLASTYGVDQAGASAAGKVSDRTKLLEGEHQAEIKNNDARARYRATIEEEMALDEKQLSSYREKAGPNAVGNPVIMSLEEKIVHLKRDLAAFDGGIAQPASH